MRAVAYVNKFLRARGGGGNNFKNLDSLLGLKPVLVPQNFWAGLRHWWVNRPL